jgi:hypothetical protein
MAEGEFVAVDAELQALCDLLNARQHEIITHLAGEADQCADERDQSRPYGSPASNPEAGA